MKSYFFTILAVFAILFISCRDDFEFERCTGNLGFSRDTIYLDTVFTNISSSTYTLKVYNKSDKDISIPKIRLENGDNTKYRLMVDGIAGTSFENVELLAKDSMYVMISVTADVADANPTDFLYTDKILFGDTGNFQDVDLVTLIQDAYFIYPQRNQNTDGSYTYENILLGTDDNGNPITLQGMELDESDPINGNELIWNASKPYVIYGYAVVPPTKTLTVQAGARIHFHAESGLIVANNASINVQGEPSQTDDLENEVIFEGDRLEPDFSDVPGQWGTLWFTKGSHSNSISNLTLKNATVGMLVSGNDETGIPTIDMENVQIYNCSNVGILARTGNMVGRNIVINNCGQTSFAGTFGGSYDFTHSTFANYWASPTQYSVVLDDYDGSSEYALTQANFKNCIIYGSSSISLAIDKAGSIFNYHFENCLIKFIDTSNQLANTEPYAFSGSHYTNCVIASTYNSNLPDFKNTDTNELIIGENSSAKGIANFSYSNGTFDILNNSRTNPSDSGAYNFIVFE